MIEIALWYHCRPTRDFRDGDLSAPAVAQALKQFCDGGLLTETYAGAVSDGVRRYQPTEALKVWVDALCSVRWPVQQWVIPKGADAPPDKPFEYRIPAKVSAYVDAK